MSDQDLANLEIFRSHFTGIAERMAHTLVRSAYTTFVKESADYATGLSTLEGELFAYPRRMGVSGFLGLSLAQLIEDVGPMEDGDIIITNDAYATAGLSTHLPDVHMVKPVFVDGEILCYAWSFIHCSDVGGLVAASISPSAYEVQQEGLRIPPTRLYRAGELDRSILRLIQANTRTPDANWGDFKAMMGALETGIRGMQAIVERFGIDDARQAMYAVLNWSEQKARKVIADVPDGVYRFSDYLDDAGDGIPIRLAVTLKIEGDRVVLDYTGTDPQVQAAFNLPAFGRRHPLLAIGIINFLFTEDPTIPITGGIVRPLEIIAPEGSIVNPRLPAAIGVRYATVIRLYNVVLGALAQAVPDRVPAAGVGQGCMVVLSSPDRTTGLRRVGVLEPFKGGGGATARTDGVAGTDPEGGDLRNTPVESLEVHLPVQVLRYELNPDSAGAGEQRGGWGTWFEFGVTEPDTIITARGMERVRFRPWGLVKGAPPGLRNSAWLNRGREGERELGRIDVLRVQPGDTVSFISTGGGGYGDPLLRSSDKVATDVRSGLLSTDAARDGYGVVCDGTGSVDADRTAALRKQLDADRKTNGLIDVGPERRAYEQVWTEEASSHLCAVLMDLPLSFRNHFKSAVHRQFPASRGTAVEIHELETFLEAFRLESGLLGDDEGYRTNGRAKDQLEDRAGRAAESVAG